MRLLKEKYNSASGALTATQEALTLSNKQLLIVKEKLAIATRIHIPVPGEDYVDSTAAASQPNQMQNHTNTIATPSPSPFPFPCPTFLQHSSKPTPFPPSLPSLHHSSPTSSHLTPQEPQDLSYKQREHKKGQQQDAVQAWANGRIVSWRGGRLVTKEKDSTAPFKLYTRPGQSAGPATDLHVDGAAESPSAVAAAAAATAALVGTPAADSMEAISVFVRDHLSNAVSISSRNLSSGIMVVRLAASLLPTLDSHAHLICCYFTPTPRLDAVDPFDALAIVLSSLGPRPHHVVHPCPAISQPSPIHFPQTLDHVPSTIGLSAPSSSNPSPLIANPHPKRQHRRFSLNLWPLYAAAVSSDPMQLRLTTVISNLTLSSTGSSAAVAAIAGIVAECEQAAFATLAAPQHSGAPWWDKACATAKKLYYLQRQRFSRGRDPILRKQLILSAKKSLLVSP
ncbi:MAG: hypothetical protein WDW38_009126 [Sanguina aurantia]